MEREFKNGRNFILSLAKDSDLLLEIKKFCRAKQIKTAQVFGIGALTSAAFGFYDQETKEYQKITRLEDLEILNCQGNVSLKEGEIFPHLHITLADQRGNAFGGHLLEGCRVFAGEFFVRELEGEPLIRENDPATGLFLWLS